MHARGAGQSAAAWHWGLASPGVTHSPDWQTIAAPQEQQSELVMHALRQTALMHACVELQSALVRH
jgi:hypothetical protein